MKTEKECKHFVSTIAPKNHVKYSKNLFTWIRKNIKDHLFPEVFADDVGTFWIGFLYEDGWFHGVRIFEVLCEGNSAKVFAYAKNQLNLTKDDSFWQRYQEIGRCAIDTKHQCWFIDDNTRWEYKGDERYCKWCGKVSQKKINYTVTKQCVKWE